MKHRGFTNYFEGSSWRLVGLRMFVLQCPLTDLFLVFRSLPVLLLSFIVSPEFYYGHSMTCFPFLYFLYSIVRKESYKRSTTPLNLTSISLIYLYEWSTDLQQRFLCVGETERIPREKYIISIGSESTRQIVLHEIKLKRESSRKPTYRSLTFPSSGYFKTKYVHRYFVLD